MAQARRVYTIDEANALLPQIRAVLLQLALEQRRLGGTPGDSEVAAGRTAIEALASLLDEMGVQLRDLGMGLVDFPAERDGQAVWLCWRLADRSVTHWHGTREGYAARRPW